MSLLRLAHFVRYLFLGVLLLILAHNRSSAQMPEFNSHEVGPDGSIVFRYFAPSAKKVEITLDYDHNHLLSMHKGDDGVWTCQTKPLEPFLHSYTFDVDGTAVYDPFNASNENGYFFHGNLVQVIGPEPQLWDVTDVPHGAVHHHFYKTEVLANLPHSLEDYYVYTPPGYDKNPKTAYPVLYLLHGWNGKASDWVTIGQANLILDNLISKKLIHPMVVVMPLGYGDLDFTTHGMGVLSDVSLFQRNQTLFGKALVSEIIPRVEAEYSIATDRKNRAIAGLSMGGGQSLTIGLNHPELFGTVAGFSSALVNDKFGEIFPQIDSPGNKDQLVWIACGNGDGLLLPNQKLISWLKTKGLNPTAVETPGIHQWPVWRDNLIHLAPLLFN